MTTYEKADPQFVEVNSTRFAYLRFGSTDKTQVPLVFLQHFRGTFDHWDPELINPIAAIRPVILIDNSGVGKSSVHKLILAGTGPSAGDGVEASDPLATQRLATASNEQQSHDAFLSAFYTLSERKQALGDRWWRRMTMARSNRSDYVDPEGTQTQIGAVVRWANRDFAFEGSYDRLQELQIPVLIANGDNDIIIPTNNSWIMFKKLVNSNAHLHLFPDVGHGFLNEYADQFSKLINIFLES
ncbi:uncharacterized protein N7458_008716 [Penicillium daleae]|uniref:AB hydrolase-1 domain-containing protein n=1 Tax=Penicillium daleae TaxID=63821 RepID=A0AAD6C3K9_9EURO|nr:uncharacterized protein N7458_008716 [Penicillium daleae]KAJ5444844.1 hypothetical protein N7458_008716 [Penicillium daleae]